MTRSIRTIASEIEKEWNANSASGVNYAAKPYLDAMFSLDKVSDSYYQDSGDSIILYFLHNASSYRGPVAKAHKAELKKIVGMK